MLRPKPHWLSLFVLAFILIAVGCAGPGATPEADEPADTASEAEVPSGAITQELIDAAQEEGSVVMYTGAHTRSQFSNLIERFEEEYGITVEGTRKPTGDIMAMIAAEQQADNIRADVVGVADLASLSQLRSEGLLSDYVPDNAGDVHEFIQVPEGDAVPFTLLMLGYAYNTNELEEPVPGSWAELAQAPLEGQVAHGNPASSGTAAGFVQTVADVAGWDFYEQIGAEGMLLQDSATAVAQLLVTGEALVALPGVESQVAQMKDTGEPVEMAYPSEGVPMNAYYLTVLEDAPHPNAARLLLAFHLSQETQQFLVDDLYSRSVLTTIEPPAGLPPLEEIEGVQPDFERLRENREQMVDQFMNSIQ